MTTVATTARKLFTPKQRAAGRHALLLARTVRRSDLDGLAQLHKTDKSSRNHGHTRAYSAHLSARRRQIRSVLEIGVGGVTSTSNYACPVGGQSLFMWADYFPNAKIVGIDIHPKNIAAPRVYFRQGDQSDPMFLRSLISEFGPFDLIVDDGSHIGRHIIASFEVLWPALKPGGFYAIEDLEAASHPTWEGGPPGTPTTAVMLLKDKIDETVAHWGEFDYRPALSAMHVYPEIAILEKDRPPRRSSLLSRLRR